MVGLLLILMAIVSLLLFLVGSSYGAALLLRVGLALGGEGSASGVSGSVFYGLQVERLEFRGFEMSIEADNVRFEVDWLALRDRHIEVVDATVGRLVLDLPPAAEPDPDEPFRLPPLPEWPDIPLTMSIQRLVVGELRLGRDGTPLPLEIDQAALHANLDADGLTLSLEGIELHGPDASLNAHGQVLLAPSPPGASAPAADAHLVVALQQGDESARLDITARGTLAELKLQVSAVGYALDVQGSATVSPFSETLPVSAVSLQVRGFEPAAWLSAAPEARLDLSLEAELAGELWPEGQFGLPRPEGLQTRLRLDVLPGSQWLGQPFEGQVQLQQDGWRLTNVATDLQLARNRVQLDGAAGAGDDAITWRLQVPQPAAFWPGLTGAADLSGRWRGLPEDHELTVEGTVTLPPGLIPDGGVGPAADDVLPLDTASDATGGVLVNGRGGEVAAADIDPAIDIPAVLAEGPYRVALTVRGEWQPGAGETTADGWQGSITRLALSNPQTGLQLGAPLALDVRLPTANTPLSWQAGATSLTWDLPDSRRIVLQHEGSQGSGDQWQTAGRVSDLVPAWLVAALPRNADPLSLDLSWDLEQAGSLAGSVQVRRRRGDIILPAETPIALGLETLELDLRATPREADVSDLGFELQVQGRTLGSVSAQGSTVLRLLNGVPVISEQQPVSLEAQLAIDDLGWAVAFTGDETELGGQLRGDVSLQRRDGEWDASGTLQADDLRVVRIDDGVRLLDGSLRARFNQDRIDVASLRFPSVIRSAPRNAAVQSWVAQYGDEGYLEATGTWFLSEARGQATVDISRYPLVQRADRFVAGSGEVQIEASPTRMAISGKVTADIGWISLEGSDELPTLASDVVVVQNVDDSSNAGTGEALALRLDLDVDFGNRMMLSGLGLNTDLTGAINVRNTSAGLRATGVVNTRDGRFSIYGQTLEVRRGTVTFNGLLDDPLLDIVAVRPNLQVQAGVQVGGTARQPQISLISFPDVPETEKLSWLLLGRGPDSRGADTGLLLSAAASLLGDDGSEPIYRQFGLDELGLRSGAGGSVSGILPHSTVVGSLNELGRGNEADQFLVAGKRLSDSLYITFQQALNGREAVVRASYRISERLSASVQGGTINGLQLVWSLLW